MLLEKQIMEQHLQETAGDLEFAERELSRRGSPTGTPPREDSADSSPRQQTPSLRQVYADDPAHLKEENERIMEVGFPSVFSGSAGVAHAHNRWREGIIRLLTVSCCQPVAQCKSLNACLLCHMLDLCSLVDRAVSTMP